MAKCYSLFLTFALTLMSWPFSAALEAQTAPEPIVIAKEEMNYRLFALKNKYASKSETITAFEVECKRTYRIETEEGIAWMSTIVLPEPIDAHYREVAPASREAHFFLQDIDMRHVKISIKRKGKVIPVETKKPKTLSKRILIERNDVYGNAQEFAYPLPRLQVGDEVRLEYLVSIPFGPNWKELLSFRIFFHGPWKKEQSRVRFAYTNGAPILINYVNGSEPDNSFELDLITDKWDFEQLPGALDELNARPHKELPHLQIFCEPRVIGVPRPERHKRIFSHQLAIQIGSTYKQYQRLYEFIELNRDTSDTSAYANLLAIFNKVGPTFAYDPDRKFYEGDHLFEAKFGEDLLAGRIRESTKYETYSAILNALGQPYNLVYAMDARYGELTATYNKPKLRGDFLFAPRFSDSTMVFLYPKFMNAGLFLEELPFYFENTTLEVQYMNHRKLTAESMMDEIYARVANQFMKAPASTADENYRATNTRVDVYAETGTLHFDTRISLAGQFSTLTRCNYISQERFPAIDSMYHTTAWDDLDAYDVWHEVTEVSPRFPYQAKIKASYMLEDRHAAENGVSTIELDQWFKHIAYAIDTANRTLDFYPDFPSNDRYAYVLQFDAPVEFIDLPASINVTNNAGSYQFHVSPAGDSGLQIMSNLRIAKAVIPATEIADLQALYHAARQVNKASIRFRKR